VIFFSRLDGCTLFSKLDLQKGYYQVSVAAADIAKTAVVTPFGLFEFVRMTFGLKNAGMTFNGLMDRIFFNLPYSFCYLEDLQYWSPATWWRTTAATCGKCSTGCSRMGWWSRLTNVFLGSPQ
jgi:hypothetical protein